MSPPQSPQIAEKLFVLSDSGEFLFWVDDYTARQMIKTGEVALLRTSKRIRGLQYLPESEWPKAKRPERIRFSPLELAARKYSHNRETETNIQGVWELSRISNKDRDLFFPAELREAA